jgi:hypothetical protein
MHTIAQYIGLFIAEICNFPVSKKKLRVEVLVKVKDFDPDQVRRLSAVFLQNVLTVAY